MPKESPKRTPQMEEYIKYMAAEEKKAEDRFAKWEAAKANPAQPPEEQKWKDSGRAEHDQRNYEAAKQQEMEEGAAIVAAAAAAVGPKPAGDVEEQPDEDEAPAAAIVFAPTPAPAPKKSKDDAEADRHYVCTDNEAMDAIFKDYEKLGGGDDGSILGGGTTKQNGTTIKEYENGMRSEVVRENGQIKSMRLEFINPEEAEKFVNGDCMKGLLDEGKIRKVEDAPSQEEAKNPTPSADSNGMPPEKVSAVDASHVEAPVSKEPKLPEVVPSASPAGPGAGGVGS